MINLSLVVFGKSFEEIVKFAKKVEELEKQGEVKEEVKKACPSGQFNITF